MNKLFQLKRLSPPLALRMLWVYVKKAFGAEIKGTDFVYLTYLYTLERCDLRHRGEDAVSFRVVTRDETPLYLRKYPSSDAQVLHQIWTEKEYEVVVQYILEHFKGRKLRIIDAGANVGYASVFLYRQLSPHYTVELIVIEPGSGNLEILKRNFLANDMTTYHIEEAGLFNKSCYLNVVKDFRDGKDWSLRVEESVAPTDLRAIEISETLDKYGWDQVDFLKMDIEGSEKDLFADDAYSATFLQRTGLISIEIHEEFHTGKKIAGALAANHFDCFTHGEITVGHNTRNK